jgi:hypothetical protein
MSDKNICREEGRILGCEPHARLTPQNMGIYIMPVVTNCAFMLL